jgi:RNA polymerase sigma factor (sigma-70 family)
MRGTTMQRSHDSQAAGWTEPDSSQFGNQEGCAPTTKWDDADAASGPTAWLPTRESLLSRLKDVSEERSWREFFETYWKLIYNTARRSGLTASEAEEVVQQTMIKVARSIGNFQYNRARGSFKAWLMAVTYSRIAQFRSKTQRNGVECELDSEIDVDQRFESRWDEEWRQNALTEALRRVKDRINPRTFQVYSFCVLQEKGARKTAKVLRMSVPAVYMVSYKVNKLIAREIKKLDKEGF